MLPILQKTIIKIFLPRDILDQISTEEQRKRVCVVAVTLMAIPFLLGYAIVHLSIGEGIENSMADLLTAGLFIATLLFLRKDVDGRIAYRTAMAGFPSCCFSTWLSGSTRAAISFGFTSIPWWRFSCLALGKALCGTVCCWGRYSW